MCVFLEMPPKSLLWYYIFTTQSFASFLLVCYDANSIWVSAFFTKAISIMEYYLVLKIMPTSFKVNKFGWVVH